MRREEVREKKTIVVGATSTSALFPLPLWLCCSSLHPTYSTNSPTRAYSWSEIHASRALSAMAERLCFLSFHGDGRRFPTLICLSILKSARAPPCREVYRSLGSLARTRSVDSRVASHRSREQKARHASQEKARETEATERSNRGAKK